MIDIDLEDYIEEVKFQMTEFDDLMKETILHWEKEARNAIHKNKGKNVKRAGNTITLVIKDEETMEEEARIFRKAFLNGKEKEYWNRFKI